MSKTKLHIVFLTPGLGNIDRGVETFTQELAQELARTYIVSIIVWKNNSKVIASLSKKGIQSIHISKPTFILHGLSLFDALPLVSTLFKLLHLDRQEREMLLFSLLAFPTLINTTYDVIFPNNGFWGALLARIIRAYRHIPFIYTSHGGIEPWIIRQKPNLYICTNREIENWILTHFPKQKTICISNGVNLSVFSPFGKVAKVPLPRPLILCVAALSPEKKLEVVIHALARLPYASILFLGKGPLKKRLIQLANSHIGKGRFLFKAVPYQEMPAFYRASDLIVNTSVSDPGDLVRFEAIACGKIVVTNAEKHLKEVLGKAAIWCDVQNSKELANAIHQGLRLKSTTVQTHKVDHFSWESVAKKYRKVLSTLV